MKTCKHCGETKPLSAYHAAPQCKMSVRPECAACTAAQMRRHRARPETKARLKAYFARPEVRAKQNADRNSPKGKASYWRRAHASPSFALSFALWRALKRTPTANPVTHAELMRMFQDQGGRCALSGIEMTWQRGKILPNSLSMDRIRPGEGYTRDNIRLVCHSVNMFRGNYDDATLLTMAKAIVAHLEPSDNLLTFRQASNAGLLSLVA